PGTYLRTGLGPPLGAALHAGDYTEVSEAVPAGSTLLLFTDGLIERRGASLETGLERLRNEAAAAEDLEALCDHLLASLPGEDIADDIAILALRPVAFTGGPLHLHLPADPLALAPMRRTLRRWLEEMDAAPEEAYAVTVACNEACANAIQHPYAAREGFLDVELRLAEGA